MKHALSSSNIHVAVAKGLETEEAPFLAQNNGISASSIRCLFISSNNTKLKEYPGERGTLQSSIREGGEVPPRGPTP